LIVNGGFEGSASSWTLAGDASWSAGWHPHSGTGYTVLGSSNRASGSEYQTVSIPADHPATLSFWLSIRSSESGSTPTDYLYAEVRSTSGALLSTLATYANADASRRGKYAQRSFSLAGWRGQTVRIQFRATTDARRPTDFRIDDVSLR
jgi:hypothetical protein